MNDNAPSDIVKNGAAHNVAVSEVTGNAESARHTVTSNDGMETASTHQGESVSADANPANIQRIDSSTTGAHREKIAQDRASPAGARMAHEVPLLAAPHEEAAQAPMNDTPAAVPRSSDRAAPVCAPFSQAAKALFHSRLADIRRSIDALKHRLVVFEATLNKETGKRAR